MKEQIPMNTLYILILCLFSWNIHASEFRKRTNSIGSTDSIVVNSVHSDDDQVANFTPITGDIIDTISVHSVHSMQGQNNNTLASIPHATEITTAIAVRPMHMVRDNTTNNINNDERLSCYQCMSEVKKTYQNDCARCCEIGCWNCVKERFNNNSHPNLQVRECRNCADDCMLLCCGFTCMPVTFIALYSYICLQIANDIANDD